MPFIGRKPTDAPLTSADIQDNIISTAKIQDGAVTAVKYIEPIPFRNIIINGDMSIAQRGTSSTGITGSGYYTCDRWRIGADTAGTWTQSQDTSVPTGQGFAKSLKLDCTTANGSLSGGSALFYTQRIEGQNLQYLKKGTANAESLTASFWVKSNKTGTYILMLDDTDNSRSFSQSYTISSADTWEKKTLTYAGDTSGAFNNDNARSFDLRFWLVAGGNFTSGTLNTSWNSNTNANLAVGQVNLADSTDNEFYITGIQLEAGTSASDFEFLPVDVNLERCQRYFQFIGGVANAEIAVGSSDSTTVASFLINYMTTMRAAPTLAYSTLVVTDNVNYDLTVNSIATSHFSIYSGRAFFNHNATATQYRTAFLKPSATSSTSGITLSSEL